MNIYMRKITIYGERCSGTNYLEKLLLLNFDVEIIWDYGWKHFFGFNDLTGSDDVLFIGIIRNLEDWLNSLYREKHHLPPDLTENIDTFLGNSFFSVDYSGNEFKFDVNIETKQKYKNIFESRLVKNKFLIKTMPKIVKNYCLITYDDLCNDFINIMHRFKHFGLEIREGIEFPLNINYHVHDDKNTFIKKINEISREKIMEKLFNNEELLFYEKTLFPNLKL